MEQVRKFEKTAQQWYKNVPHLPLEFTKWLSENIWWLIIIGVVVSVLGLLALVPVALIALGISSGVAASYGLYDTGLGAAWISVLITIVGAVIVTVLEAMAINPLKNKSIRGWELLFIVALVNFAFGILANLANITIFGLLFNIVWLVVHGYFLFEIRSHFGATAKTVHKPIVKTKAKV